MVTTGSTRKKVLDFAILQGILPIEPSRLPAEIIAGATLAALAIPEVMGYTKIAGTPVVTGLYTLLIPMLLFAVFGSSRHLVVGADSATAAIMAAGLVGIAAQGTPEYMAYAGILAILAGLLLVLARVVRLGFLADFLSRTVLIGFLTGVGVQVAIGQIAGILDIPGGGTTTLAKVSNDFQQLGEINWPSFMLSLAVMAIILVCRRINRKIPGALLAVIGSILLSYVVPLPNYGITLLGPVPGGLPQFGIPHADLSVGVLEQLLAIAFSMFIVILAQSAATSRAYANRYNERFSENIDMVGLSLANFGAAFSGAFVVNGSPTKTQMVDGAGGRSQIAQVATSLIVLIVLLFLTEPLSYLPNTVLAAVVFLIGVELVDLAGMRRVLAERPVEFWVAAITAAVVIVAGVEPGILLAVVLSLLVHTRHGYRSRNTVVATTDGGVHPVPIERAVQTLPGLVIYRFNHSMYYANAEQLTEEVTNLSSLGPAPVRWFCFDLVAVDDIDFSSAAALRDACKELQSRQIRPVFADVSEHVRHELDVSDLSTLIGGDAAFYLDINAVIVAYQYRNTAK